MIKTTRSRLEIRQEPDKTSSFVGALLVAAGLVEAAFSTVSLMGEYATPNGRGLIILLARIFLSCVFAALGWIFLRGRSRVVLDLDHRMVARYLGVGGQAVGGNRSWDLAEFAAVVLVRREHRRLITGLTARSAVVCLRRPDGTDLELYWPSDGSSGADVASRVSSFSGLPFLGAGRAR